MRTEWRVACVRIPRFPIGAAQRARHRTASEKRDGGQLLLPMETTPAACSSSADTHWDEQLLVLNDGAETRPKLRGVTAAAAREGVRAGMSLSEARALCGALDVMTWDDFVIDAAIGELTAALVSVSPQVTPVRGVPGM